MELRRNHERYKPLHAAVQSNDVEKVKKILSVKTKSQVNVAMPNGETALHIAAQYGYCDILSVLIDEGGDLDMRDEDGHTPLHDCLQQVYFKSDNSEEKCDKFVGVWYKIVQKVVRWWHLKYGVEEPMVHSEQYLKLQRHAIYYLRSYIKNNDGLSVLQFAADRGLVTCVQTMLSTRDVFVIQTEISTEHLKRSTTEEEAHRTKEFKTITVHEIDVTNLCPEYSVTKSTPNPKSPAKKTTSNNENQADDGERTSFLDALAEVKPPDKAGKILESIPMRSLCRLDWRISQRIHLLWMMVHLVLIILAAVEIRVTDKNSTERSAASTALGVIVLMYVTIIRTSHFMVKVMRFRRQRRNKDNRKTFIRGSIERYERNKEKEGIFDCIMPATVIFDEVVFLTELIFAGFAWAVYIWTMANYDRSDYVWIEGFFLLFAFLMLLIPVTSYSRVYKLISVLKYILRYDILPWTLIYVTISTGFATAIRLQFDQLPSNSTCDGEQPDLAGFLQDTGNTVFELVAMTSGLDTELKNVRHLACLFHYNDKSGFVILLMITMYAISSAIVLLNMLIAIMSNTVTEAQKDKGWRQYKVSDGFNVDFLIKT